MTSIPDEMTIHLTVRFEGPGHNSDIWVRTTILPSERALNPGNLGGLLVRKLSNAYIDYLLYQETPPTQLKETR
jgi:hypothetical protein